MHYVASMAPTDALTPEQVAARLPPAAKHDLLEWAPDQDAAKYLQPVVTHEYGLPDLSESDPSVAITDDHPFNEYFLLRRLGALKY